MWDFPSCFSESGIQIASASAASSSSSSSSSSSTTTSPSSSFPSVSSLYHAYLNPTNSLLITVTWIRSLLGPTLSLSVEDSRLRPLCKIHVKPSLFSTRKGSRTLHLSSHSADLFWDLSSATFPSSSSSPEPLSGFYVALVLDLKLVLLLGDLTKDAYRRTGAHPPPHPASLLTRREHLSGKGLFSTRAHLAGRRHEISIECGASGDPSLEIRIDRRRVAHVKRLVWKFRGNQTIVVDGSPVEVLWDVHSWFFGGPPPRCAVFAFHPCSADGDPWEEPLSSSLILHAWRNE